MLSKAEINLRMIELRNLRTLHAAQKVRIGKLEEQVRLLKRENMLRRSANTVLTATVQDLKLQMEELRTIVFGRKRKKDDEYDDVPPSAPTTPVVRTADSYKRALPTDHEVTEQKNHPIDECARCRGPFSERETVTYFEEDIPLPRKKTVIRHTIEKGYCEACKRWSIPVPLPTAPVILGNNVNRYVTYLSVVWRQSYAQIQDVLEHTQELTISQGEIAKILEKEGDRLRPEYERLKARIRGEPSVHLDETGWNLFIGDGYRGYAWTMAGGTSGEAAFVLGKTRAKGNADDLLGDSEAVVVSDDYVAYRNLNSPHQLCCSHLQRQLHDLALSGEIKDGIHNHCVAAYHTFARIYADIERAKTGTNLAASYDTLHQRLKACATPHPSDPAKLSRIKKQVAERSANYLTCLLHPSVASDNNLAERSLRHLVLKRKISFGSLSERTAETLAILLSVLLSYKQRDMLRGYLMGV
jgi:hypothetical protein